MATSKTSPKTAATKSPDKSAPKSTPVPAAPKAPVRPVAPVPAAKGEKAAKPPKVALVRDSFTMPEPDFALIAMLKARALESQRTAKKSELLRAGLQALATLDGESLVVALDRLAPVKTGRPKKGH